jgi:diaminopimelate decarboxylase
VSAPALVPNDPDPSAAELIAARPHLSVHAMDGLVMEGVPLNAIADAVGTPTWVLGAGTIRARLRTLRAALAGLDAAIHYAVKANDHLAVLSLVAGQGAGADVVSGGELLRARRAGIPPDRIVFAGVGKTEPELRLAIAEGIAQVNAESAEELDMLSAIAAGMGRQARVALRVNPDVDAGTHAKITTGRAENKFGIAWTDAVALYARAATLPGLRPVGLSMHIGSQILATAPYRAAFARTAELVRDLRAAGQAVETVDCGGGLGIGYRDEPAASPEALAGAMRAAFGGLDLHLAVEPGRWLVGPAGLLLAAVVLVKQGGGRRFVVLDAAMNDLLRPAMYDAWHGIVPVSAADLAAPATQADIVGPVCESGDTFARRRPIAPLRSGARVAILDAGAYGAVMSSTYNARPLAAQVMVDGDQWAVIRPRQAVETLWADEAIPAFASHAMIKGATR